jgi:hypothetical protein
VLRCSLSLFTMRHVAVGTCTAADPAADCLLQNRRSRAAGRAASKIKLVKWLISVHGRVRCDGNEPGNSTTRRSGLNRPRTDYIQRVAKYLFKGGIFPGTAVFGLHFSMEISTIRASGRCGVKATLYFPGN